MKNIFINSVQIAKQICERKLRAGATAVDCTMGNGNDTTFLCHLVGDSGKVYAFDIQEAAVSATSSRLMQLGLHERAQLILDGHENIDRYISQPVDLVIFNLGYLPKGDHHVTTRKETTIAAIKKSMDLLNKNGAILIVVYPGHENGKQEQQALEEFTSQINQKEYTVVRLSFLNQMNHPPELIGIEKVCKDK